MKTFWGTILFFILLFPTLLLASAVYEITELLERANDKPRLIKTSTILDCRQINSSSPSSVGMIDLHVDILDISNEVKITYYGPHSKRENWDIFQYKISEENDHSGWVNELKLQDVYQDRKSILYRIGKIEYVFNKETMILSSPSGKKWKELNNYDKRVLKCRYL